VTTDTDLPLAAEFPPADPETWRALVDKVLKGAAFDKLVSRTYDGIEIQPLYTRGDVSPVDELPGQAPFTRARRAGGSPEHGWSIRVVAEHPDPAAANAGILEDLEGGAASIWLRLALANAHGVDGVEIADVDGLDRTLAGVHLDLATIVLDAGQDQAEAARLLIELWDRRSVAGDQRQANLGLDPLRTLVTSGRLDSGLDTALAQAAELAAQTVQWPHVRAIEVDTAPWVDAGASEGQELAIAVATGVAYLRALVASGLGVDDAANQIGFTLSADADVFATIAKLRSARRLWAHAVMLAGASATSAAPPFSVRTAGRMITRRDPWVNMLRTTAACFAAGVAGASSVIVTPFDDALGRPSDHGRRVARNTQLILQEESNLGRVIDPAAGSYYLERLTDELTRVAWGRFQHIEALGGIAAAVLDGSLAGQVAQTSAERAARIATRRDPITGVSEFPNLGESLPEPMPRSRRSSGAPPAAATVVTPLPVVGLADDFEALRSASDRFLAASGARPRVFLANLGPVAVHTARATFARNFLEAGGIEAVDAGGFDDDASLVEAFVASGATVAVLCSSDAVYADRAGAAAAALRTAGAARLLLAGHPGERRADYTDAGIGAFIHLGVDVLASLRTLHDHLGVSA
jgi:methylmalonyl-CoA mutase